MVTSKKENCFGRVMRGFAYCNIDVCWNYHS